MSNSDFPQQKKAFNVWKWLGIGCGGCLLTSILAIGGLGYFVYKNLQLSGDSTEVVETARAIFDYEIPGGSRGLLTFKFMDIEFAQITNKNEPLEVLMLVGKAPEEYVNSSEDLKIISDSFVDNQNSNFKVSSQETVEKELCGETVQVLVQQGEFTFDERSQTEQASSYTAIVNYNNTARFVWLVANGAESNEKASQVFDSLECK